MSGFPAHVCTLPSHITGRINIGTGRHGSLCSGVWRLATRLWCKLAVAWGREPFPLGSLWNVSCLHLSACEPHSSTISTPRCSVIQIVFFFLSLSVNAVVLVLLIKHMDRNFLQKAYEKCWCCLNWLHHYHTMQPDDARMERMSNTILIWKQDMVIILQWRQRLHTQTQVEH